MVCLYKKFSMLVVHVDLGTTPITAFFFSPLLKMMTRALISVHFVAFELPSSLLFQFIDHRVDHAVGTAPWNLEFLPERGCHHKKQATARLHQSQQVFQQQSLEPCTRLLQHGDLLLNSDLLRPQNERDVARSSNLRTPATSPLTSFKSPFVNINSIFP